MKKRKLFLAIGLAFIAVPLNAECPPTPMPYTIIDPILEAPVTKYTGDITGNGEATQWTDWTFKIRLLYNDTVAQTVGGSTGSACSWSVSVQSHLADGILRTIQYSLSRKQKSGLVEIR